jgi:hypothetical protein
VSDSNKFIIIDSDVQSNASDETHISLESGIPEVLPPYIDILRKGMELLASDPT